MNFSEAIKENRLSRNLSLMDIEKGTGISNGSISRWENGQVIPGINFCITLAKFYGITIDELVGLSDEPTKGDSISHSLPTKLPDKSIAFVKEYEEIFDDNNYVNMSKLYKAITPELRALTLGYLVGLLQSQGIDTQKILRY